MDDASLLAVRQAAAVYFKNLIERRYLNEEDWEEEGENYGAPINEADRLSLRQSIVQAVMQCGQQAGLREQLLCAFSRMLRQDWPRRWPELLPTVMATFGTAKSMESSLLLFHALTEWRSHGDAAMIKRMHQEAFPPLLSLAQQAFAQQEWSIVKQVLKIFYKAIQFKPSAILFDPAVFSAWFTLSYQVLSLPLSAAVACQPFDAEGPLLPFWSMVKWSMHLNHRLLARYGSAKLETHYATDDEAEAVCVLHFARAYGEHAAQPVCQAYLALVGAVVGGQLQLPARLLCLSCDYLDSALRDKPLWTSQIEPQIAMLITGLIHPRLCFTAEDEEAWEDDPVQFVSTRLDPWDDCYSPAAACLNLLQALCRHRRKTCFVPCLNLINSLLQGGSSVSVQSLEGAIHMLGALSDPLVNSKEVSAQSLWQLLSGAISPLCTHQHRQLRMRACWAIAQFSELEWEGGEALLTNLLSQVVTAVLQDPEMPVQVAAVEALGSLLDHSAIHQHLIPLLPTLIERILNLANQLDMDCLSLVLERMVECFSAELTPYGQQLAAQLVANIQRQLEQGNAGGEDGFESVEKMMACLGMFSTLIVLLDSMASTPALMAGMEPILMPLVERILQAKLTDVYEECFTVLDCITYTRKSISEGIWRIVPLIGQVLFENGSAYLNDMSVTVDNVISYGPELLQQHAQMRELIVRMIMHCLTQPDEMGEGERVVGCQWAAALLLNVPVERECLLALVQAALPFLGLNEVSEDNDELRCFTQSGWVHHLELVLHGLRLAPPQVIELLSAAGKLDWFMERLKEHQEYFIRCHDKQVLIITVTSILDQAEQLPPASHPHLPFLVSLLAEASLTYPKALQERARLKAEMEKEADDDEEEQEEKASEHQDDDDSDYYPESDDDDYYGDEEEDDEDAGDLEEDPLMETRLDTMDMNAILKQSMHSLQSRIPANALEQLFAKLTVQQRKALLEI